MKNIRSHTLRGTIWRDLLLSEAEVGILPLRPLHNWMEGDPILDGKADAAPRPNLLTFEAP